jgi:hypothetical protein
MRGLADLMAPGRVIGVRGAVRHLAPILLAAAVLAGGCGLSTTPYDARLACESVGARYTADGRCQAGSP